MFGEWLSLVEHLVRDQGVGGSNPLSPTILSILISITYKGYLQRTRFARSPKKSPIRKGDLIIVVESIRNRERKLSTFRMCKRARLRASHIDSCGDLLPDDGSSCTHPRRPTYAVGRPTLAPTHPPGPLRAPRERRASRSLRARSGSGKGRDTPASDAA